MRLGPTTLAGVPSRARLGQSPDSWLGRARAAVSDYDRLLGEAATVADTDARGEILKWVGRSDVPGSPAERYAAVRMDVQRAEADGAPAAYSERTAQARVEQLEDAVRELDANVSRAIEAYGALPAPEGAGGATQAADSTAMCVTGGIALLGLVVLPLLVG